MNFKLKTIASMMHPSPNGVLQREQNGISELFIQEPKKKQSVKNSEARLQRRSGLIKALLAELNNGINVPITRIKQALTSDEYAGYRLMMHQTAKSQMTTGDYRLLKQYGEHLRVADKLHALAESKPWKRPFGLKNVLKKSPHRKAESAYEKAYEYLVQLCSIPHQLFDRTVYFSHGEYPDLDAESAPRLIGSRSQYALKDIYAVKLESIALKKEFLKSSLSEIKKSALLVKES